MDGAVSRKVVPGQTVERLSLYRKLLQELVSQARPSVFSYELAALAGQTAVTVRRDLMAIGSAGSPNKGYDVVELRDAIGDFLDGNEVQQVALVGIGNLGRALLAYFRGLRPQVEISAAFDVDRAKVGRVIVGVRVAPLDGPLEEISSRGIRVAILAVPAGSAQEVADRLVAAGVLSLLNFTHVRLRLPAEVHCEDIDLSVALGKVIYYARRRQAARGEA